MDFPDFLANYLWTGPLLIKGKSFFLPVYESTKKQAEGTADDLPASASSPSAFCKVAVVSSCSIRPVKRFS